MGGSRKNPKVAKDGTIPMTVRLPPALHARLLARSQKDGMFLNALIPRLIEFGLDETEMVIRKKAGAASAGQPEKKDATGSGTRRRAGGE